MVFWRQVRFPPIFSKLTHVFGVFGFAVFDVGSFKCLFGWTYFDKLLFVTLAPFGVIALGIILYGIINRDAVDFKLRPWEWPPAVRNRITYWALFFIYVVLPSISTFVITYFSCARFDRGDRKDLKVIAVELSVKCTSSKYKTWTVYAAIMIAPAVSQYLRQKQNASLSMFNTFPR